MKNVFCLLVVAFIQGQNMPVQTWIHTSGETNLNLTGLDAYKMPIYMETWHQFQDGVNPNLYHTVGFSTNGSMLYQRTDVTTEGTFHRSIQYFGTDLRPMPVNTTPKGGKNETKANTFNSDPW